MLQCAADGLLSPFLKFRFGFRITIGWGQQLCRVGAFNFSLQKPVSISSRILSLRKFLSWAWKNTNKKVVKAYFSFL